jgi:hypothetical protein
VAGKKQLTEVRLKIELFAVGRSLEFEDGGKNEYVSIRFNETQDLGSNFAALRSALDDQRSRGVKAETPILISPTMGCRHKWVVRAFDAAVAARFTNIQFAVPYE